MVAQGVGLSMLMFRAQGLRGFSLHRFGVYAWCAVWQKSTFQPLVGSHLHMGGCQNYGPSWIPIIIRHLIFRVPKKGTTILTTTHIEGLNTKQEVQRGSGSCLAQKGKMFPWAAFTASPRQHVPVTTSQAQRL